MKTDLEIIGLMVHGMTLELIGRLGFGMPMRLNQMLAHSLLVIHWKTDLAVPTQIVMVGLTQT